MTAEIQSSVPKYIPVFSQSLKQASAVWIRQIICVIFQIFSLFETEYYK